MYAELTHASCCMPGPARDHCIPHSWHRLAAMWQLCSLPGAPCRVRHIRKLLQSPTAASAMLNNRCRLYVHLRQQGQYTSPAVTLDGCPV